MALTGSPKNYDTGLSFPHSLDLLSGTRGNQKLGKESRSLYFLMCCPLADPTACQPIVPPEGCDSPTPASTAELPGSERDCCWWSTSDCLGRLLAAEGTGWRGLAASLW